MKIADAFLLALALALTIAPLLYLFGIAPLPNVVAAIVYWLIWFIALTFLLGKRDESLK